MKLKKTILKLLFVLVLGSSVFAQERVHDFNFDWKFKLVEDTTIPTQIPLEDSKWRDIRLPHDWSVEHSFRDDLEGCTGYLPGGVGVYQKHFKTPINIANEKAYVLFDGVYCNATFWLNGKKLGENPYGYSPAYFDLTNKLKADGSDNILTVHVDHSRYADGRWYTGSGIYRNVQLITTNKLHIPIWGTYVTTPEISEENAIVKLETKVKNDSKKRSKFTLATEIYDANGILVASSKSESKLSSSKEIAIVQNINVENPKLWDLDSPNMYKAVTKVIVAGKTVDNYTTPFGFRTIKHIKNDGFFLNGKSTFVKGVCIHHDGGLVGAAVPKGVWKRRLQALKDAGVNAIRTSHNPFSQEFYDLCDEMGLLVQAEIFDEFDNPKDKRWNMQERKQDDITDGYTTMHFQKWAKSDLTRSMLRDRNHPSIFEWSIGNEIEWTYEHYRHVSGLWDPGAKGYWNRLPNISAKEMQERYKNLPDRKYKLTETAQKLANWTREIDNTRPVTANLIIPVASLASGYAQTLDIVGFSYQIKQYDWSKKNYPNLHFTGNENAGTWEEWNSIIEDPMIYSMYMWTGIDYLGEANNKWPQKGWDGDILDFAGFKKVGWDHFKTIWVNKPHISLGTYPVKDSLMVDPLSGKVKITSPKFLKWNNQRAQKIWNYKKGQTIIVEVPSNLPKAELLLNGKSLGWRTLSGSPDRILRWAVPYEPGILTARAGFDGQEVEVELKTTTQPVKIELTVDKSELDADGYDVAHIIAQLVDKDGNHVKTTEVNLTFEVDGDIKVLGVDNGSNTSIQDYQTNTLKTSKGRALLLVQSFKKSSLVKIKASSTEFNSNTIQIQTK
ncbi:glycoside hydrolase family 2 TIM barrel-domain containing protein [Lutibacter sp. TH_r2]|uniref:glycoside hydrolase family 2 TIM barrel-domain containing protein n=1 Tax=Lutibacter sp. TH_r2 TaxID=3082083 RepID=UPI0029537B88|nr:glycoside hydrolase family 2 TIM barrel-domain containing protein [Lutibacter sp. TH_r2]MDV7188001.1 glycoside hydrolase family 2 TIM barrel-domain containing protein [Lutibacter sp. TH_r2]